MKFNVTQRPPRGLQVAFALCLLLALTSFSRADFFGLPGGYFYQGINVFDVDTEGTVAVNLTNGEDNIHDAVVTVFNPRTGKKQGSKIAGFGPLGIKLTKTNKGVRIVVLTSEGGSGSVTVFKLKDSGKLAQKAKIRLTDSNSDERSNIVFGPDGSIGFIVVPDTPSQDRQLVAFNVLTGAVVSRTVVPVPNGAISITQLEGRSLLLFTTFFPLPVLRVMDVTNASEPREIGTVDLTPPGAPRTVIDDHSGFAFRGNMAFVANRFFDLAVVDLSSMQLVASGFGGESVIDLRPFRDQSNRLMLLTETTDASSQTTRWLVLVDASNPQNLIELGRSETNIRRPTDYSVGAVGDRVYLAADTRLRVLSLPTFNLIWDSEIPNPQGNIPFQVRTFGQPEYVISTWGIFESTFGSFVVPEISAIGPRDQHLEIRGAHFESGAIILIDGSPWETISDGGDPGVLIAKKLLKRFDPAQAISVQVQNPSGAVTPASRFVIP